MKWFDQPSFSVPFSSPKHHSVLIFSIAPGKRRRQLISGRPLIPHPISKAEYGYPLDVSDHDGTDGQLDAAQIKLHLVQYSHLI